MNNYKYLNEEKNSVLMNWKTIIIKDGYGWDKFLNHLKDGGIVKPWRTEEEILLFAKNKKLNDLEKEYQQRIDFAIGTSSARKKDKMLSRAIKLLRKEVKGTINQDEKTELDLMESLDNYLDLIENHYEISISWINDELRTQKEIDNFNAEDSIFWPDGV